MERKTIRVLLCCASCGGRSFSLPEHPRHDSVVTCTGCGAHWDYQALQRAAADRSYRHEHRRRGDHKHHD